MDKARARTILITGGAGFIGSNLAQRLLRCPEGKVRQDARQVARSQDIRIRLFDDLSRRGVESNLEWLQELAQPGQLEFIQGDVRDAALLASAAKDVTEIYHLAAQVAVTTSIDDPRADFSTNVLGTFNVLEAARRNGKRPFLLFTSTNKVYGSLHGVPVSVQGSRYSAVDPAFAGVTEAEPLDFHSPYGCSKGAADQYVRDYARIYGLPTVVFRMSCIAGPRQFGTEDQGWVAHFLYSVLEGRPITIYGDGFQVRDVLHVSDLVDAISAARTHVERTAGQIYNLGGGPGRAISITDMLDAIEQELGRAPLLRFSKVRPGDQPLYISNTAKLTAHTGWRAQHSLPQTLADIHRFWRENRGLLREQRNPVPLAELVEEVA